LLVCTAGIVVSFFVGKAAQLLPAFPRLPLTATQYRLNTCAKLQPIPDHGYTHCNINTYAGAPDPHPHPCDKADDCLYRVCCPKTACTFASPQGVTRHLWLCLCAEIAPTRAQTQFQLAVAIYHSTSANPAPDPVIFLQGGPGGQAVQLSADDYDILVKPIPGEARFHHL